MMSRDTADRLSSNTKAPKNPDFDAIVVGSGISGGWAAKELTEKGLKVLVLERGKMIRHGEDYKTEHQAPWEKPFGGKPLRELYKSDYPIQSKNFSFDESTRHFYINDRENPYQQEKPFTWTRADVLGGKSLLWSRQVYRWSDLDFEANKKDGHGIDWPIRYDDIKDWYSHVESFAGVSGEALGLPHLPDGVFQKPMELNAVEKSIKASIESNYDDRHLTIGRTAVQTEAKNGRGACHYCGPCERGCSVGAYFSSLSSTLPAAEKTGNLTIRANAIVEELEVDPETKKISAVRIVDTETGERIRFTSKLVFLCASAMASNQIMLNSRSDTFPNGIANGSGTLGHYVMDHFGDAVFGVIPGFEDRYYSGNRPNNFYIPRFRNLQNETEGHDFVRGYGFQGAAMRTTWNMMAGQVPGFGANLKHALMQPGPWLVFMGGFGEQLPRYENHVSVDDKNRDRFGVPQIKFSASFGENSAALRKDMIATATEMLEKSGGVYINSVAHNKHPGDAIHEMGGARMGDDPSNSVLNKHNQAHEVANLFVTDGACMTSASCVNPSLTYMALTARAADYAVKQLHAGLI